MVTKLRIGPLFLFGLLVFALAANAAGPAGSPLPATKPEQVGLSSERLKRIHDMIEGYRERGEIAGAVTVVIRRGKLAHFEAQGFSDIEARKPMRPDDILRIASMTKPIATVGALMLLEEQRFLLEDPVSKYLPEFRDMKVAVGRPNEPGYKLVPAERQVTIHDLLSHRSGLSRGTGTVNSLSDFTKSVAASPLLFQPGAGWNYGPSTDVLGRLIEVISGKTLDQFLRARLFNPLGMTDTHFTLPKENWRGSPWFTEKIQEGSRRLQTCRTCLSHGLNQPPEVWSRPRRTTCASPRCWPMAANSKDGDT